MIHAKGMCKTERRK